MKSKFTSFGKYIEQNLPLPWTIVNDHPAEWLIGNDEMTINFIRFRYIVEAAEKYFTSLSELNDFDNETRKLFKKIALEEAEHVQYAKKELETRKKKWNQGS